MTVRTAPPELATKTQDAPLARPEDFQALTKAVEQTIANIMTQSEINNALVSRLLEVERRVAELEQGGAPTVFSGGPSVSRQAASAPRPLKSAF